MVEDKAAAVEPAGGSVKVSQRPPTKADLARVAGIKVFNSKREPVPFGSLMSDDPEHRTLLVFIRHFLCGFCQEYLRTLCSSVTAESLAGLPHPTSIVVIGCGQPALIDFYAEATSCNFPIYAEPTKKLYRELGMGRTLDIGSSKPDYMQRSMSAVMLASIWQGLGQGSKAFRAGDYWQVGGEFLVRGRSDVLFAHRMTNTRDHAEVPRIREAIGLDRAAVPLRKKRWSLVGGAGLGRQASVARSKSKAPTKPFETVGEEDKENIRVGPAAA